LKKKEAKKLLFVLDDFWRSNCDLFELTRHQKLVDGLARATAKTLRRVRNDGGFRQVRAQKEGSFFASFCSQKEDLPSFHLPS
jgi:hypothetical protein